MGCDAFATSMLVTHKRENPGLKKKPFFSAKRLKRHKKRVFYSIKNAF